MMKHKFVAADHHLFHRNILNFTRTNSEVKLRVFDDTTHMHEHIIKQHNSVVMPEDTVFFLGDLTLSRSSESLEMLNRFNGRKILVKGNHDVAKIEDYLKYFLDVCSVVEIGKKILTHIPIHPRCVGRWNLNIHGHLHDDVVLLENSKIPDLRYLCVSMEQLDNYTPLNLNTLK